MTEPQTQLTSNSREEVSVAQSTPAGSSAAPTMISRCLRALAWIVFILATLLAFPCHLTMLTGAIAAVIFCCLALDIVRQAALVSFVAGAILISKTPSLQIDFLLLTTVLMSAGVAYFFVSSKLRWSAFAITVAAVAFFGVKRTLDAQSSQNISIDDQRSIICLGDSLTEGERGGYPAELQKLVAAPVLNFGRNGYTTRLAIDDLLPKIKQEQPQLVVLEIGGHDYNNGEPREQTKTQLKQIIQELISDDITVVIVEIPRGLISDPFYGIERELAAEFDLQLIPDTIIRQFVFFSPMAPPGYWLDPSHHLSEDALHPNQRGQVEFAKVVAEAIKK